ncbi:MAG: ABC transporter substrate-binding protein [Candidatus Parcubacteria bacterium]|nr:ABC transporter substrate-binding protein [Burkholderiales bacterium]
MKFKAAFVALAFSGAAFAQTQGVSKGEVVIGTMQDLSGPIVAFSKQLVAGMNMRVDEINANGGINGRKLKLVVEDHGYDPKKAVLATQKLVQKDKIFAMIGTIGTPTALPSMPILFDKNIPHLFPLTAAREMYEPLHKLKYSFAATYFDQMKAGVKHLVKLKGSKKVCTLYQDDDFGAEVMRGAEAGLKDINMVLAEKTTYKRGATDFSSQVARMKDAGCDLVVLGTIIRETLGAIGTARKLGWGVDFMGSSASYTELIHKLGGPAMNGFYSTNTVNMPYLDDASSNVRGWAQRYKEKYKEDPAVFSVYGYQVVDLFAQVVDKTGANLTTDNFINTLDKFTSPRDMFGADTMSFTKTKHLGSNRSRLSQIINGKWTPLTDYITD